MYPRTEAMAPLAPGGAYFLADRLSVPGRLITFN